MTNGKKTTRRALISSALSLLLCFTMLIGTTFAWFTDTAKTQVNKIQAGELDIELGMYDDEGNWTSYAGKTLEWQKAEGVEEEAVLWEPGCTYALEPLMVRNSGNLALKYKIDVTGIKGDEKLNEVIDWTIEVDEPMAIAGVDAETLNTEHHLEAGEHHSLVIYGHMQEDADNTYQGLSIENVSITVYATQDTVEYDSLGNNYDANAALPEFWDGTTTAPDKNEDTYHISTAQQFVQYINELNNSPATKEHRYDMATAVLDADIDLGGAELTASGAGYMFSGSFDGNGHTVSNFTVKRTDGAYYTGLFSVYLNGGTIKNLTVKNGTVISNGKQVAAIVPSVYENATVENCHAIGCFVSGVKKVGAVTGYAQTDGTVKDCSAKDCFIYASNNDTVDANLFGYNNGGTFTGNTDKGNNVMKFNAEFAAAGVVKLSADTYEISNVEGLQWFNDQVNNHGNSFNNQTIKLASDIDMKGAKWIPVGQNFTSDANGVYAGIGYANTVEFHGTFDGNDKTISNINISALTEEQMKTLNDTEGSISDQDIYSVGFFAYSNGTVKNLTIKNATVTGYHNVGTIVGYGDTTTYIENCHVENTTIIVKHLNADQCGDKVGGVIGYMNDTATGADVKNCSVKNTTITAGRDAGQVIGCAAPGSSQAGCSAENVTVSASEGCTGANIKNDIIGR